MRLSNVRKGGIKREKTRWARKGEASRRGPTSYTNYLNSQLSAPSRRRRKKSRKRGFAPPPRRFSFGCARNKISPLSSVCSLLYFSFSHTSALLSHGDVARKTACARAHSIKAHPCAQAWLDICEPNCKWKITADIWMNNKQFYLLHTLFVLLLLQFLYNFSRSRKNNG